MHRFLLIICFFLALVPHVAAAGPASFSGTWTLDFRSPEERRQKEACGFATFVLKQSGRRITGDHQMATVRCGRMNEGGEGTVKGMVVGDTAVLVVTSGRNGAVLLGRATLRGGALEWEITKDILAGEPEGDSPLILRKGTLLRAEK